MLAGESWTVVICGCFLILTCCDVRAHWTTRRRKKEEKEKRRDAARFANDLRRNVPSIWAGEVKRWLESWTVNHTSCSWKMTLFMLKFVTLKIAKWYNPPVAKKRRRRDEEENVLFGNVCDIPPRDASLLLYCGSDSTNKNVWIPLPCFEKRERERESINPLE